ncbi:MAG: methyl-accepting chemotaxis protein [Desulforhopalus sp.]
MTDCDELKFLNLDKIKDTAKNLNSLGPETEPEFLAIGKVLNTLSTICYGMTDNAVKLSNLANFKAGENDLETGSFIEKNADIFDGVAAHVKETLISLNDGEHLLTELLLQMKKLREPIRNLYSIGKTFRVLGVGIKVESSRTKDGLHGFTLLAEEVSDIAKLVQDNCRYCIDKADLVETGIAVSQRVLNSTDNTYDDSGEKAIHNILQDLEDLGHRSDLLAAGIQERSAEMVQGISDVVMAMQFHDITRQQLENVSSALLEVIEKGNGVSLNETGEQTVLEIYTILSIQAAHLNSIYEQIINARRQIVNGLGKTMEQAGIQAKDAKTLLEMECRTGNVSIVADLEKEIDNIVSSLNTSLQVVKKAAEVSRDVYGNVLEIGSFVGKIEEIAFDVKILAINAMVEALKTEAAGNALIVLAKELSNLSQETRDGATASINMLQSIMEGTEQQLEFSVNLDQNSLVVHEMIKKAKDCTDDILSSLQEISRIGQKMDNAGLDLSRRIIKLIPTIKFPQIMGDRIDSYWQMICSTIDQIEERYPQFIEGNSEVKKMLEEMAKQYVMDRERSIHAQVTGGSAAAAGTGEVELFDDDGFELFTDDAPGEQLKNADFGENVELF